MGFNGTAYSKSTYYRRLKKSVELGCSIDCLPDGRGKGSKSSGAQHYRWNSGRMLSKHGYVKVRVGAEHLLADSNGYAYEHLVVWCAAGNSPPNHNELLHHKNDDKTDNRYGNLELITRANHNTHHNLMRGRDARGRFLSKRAGRLLDGVEHSGVPV